MEQRYLHETTDNGGTRANAVRLFLAPGRYTAEIASRLRDFPGDCLPLVPLGRSTFLQTEPSHEITTTCGLGSRRLRVRLDKVQSIGADMPDNQVSPQS
jgi:hypothetical protein